MNTHEEQCDICHRPFWNCCCENEEQEIAENDWMNEENHDYDD